MPLSFEIQKLIIENLREGMCKLGIARTYNISLGTVYVIENQGIARSLPLKRTIKSNNVKILVSRAIIALKKIHSLASFRKVANKIRAILSKSTIRRNLISLGFKYLHCKKKSLLNRKRRSV